MSQSVERIEQDPTRADRPTFTTHTGLHIGPPQPPSGPALEIVPTHENHSRGRPPARLGRHYPAPTGGPLHLHLVDLTPT